MNPSPQLRNHVAPAGDSLVVPQQVSITGVSRGLVSLILIIAAICVFSGTENFVSADTLTWSGARANDNWDFVSNNWTPGSQAYSDFDDVIFDSQAIGTASPVLISSNVQPSSILITGQHSGSWAFSGADIIGATTFTQASNSNRPISFSQDNLSFSGGTSLAGTGVLTFAPTSTGTASHQFGSGPITLKGGTNGGFRFSPTDTANTHTLTNDFIIASNGGTWRNPGTGGVLGGTVTMNGKLNMPSGGDIINNPITLNTDATISRSKTAGVVTIGSNVNGGGTASLTIDHAGGNNVDWRTHIDDDNSPTAGWNIRNLIKDATGNGRGTLELAVDERDFFDNITANGGAVVLNGGSMRFMRSSTVEVEFALEVNNGSQGFNSNDVFNIRSTGSLSGDGTVAHQNGYSNHTGVFDDAVNVNVFTDGEISPGTNQGADVGILTLDGDLTFSGGTLTMNVMGGDTAGVDYDQLIVQDSASSTGLGKVLGISTADLVIDFSGLSLPSVDGDVLTILTSSNNLTSQSFHSVSFIGGIHADINYGNGFITLSNFAVPEPGTLGLLLFGMAGLTARRRRKRQQA